MSTVNPKVRNLNLYRAIAEQVALAGKDLYQPPRSCQLSLDDSISGEDEETFGENVPQPEAEHPFDRICRYEHREQFGKWLLQMRNAKAPDKSEKARIRRMQKVQQDLRLLTLVLEEGDTKAAIGRELGLSDQTTANRLKDLLDQFVSWHILEDPILRDEFSREAFSCETAARRSVFILRRRLADRAPSQIAEDIHAERYTTELLSKEAVEEEWRRAAIVLYRWQEAKVFRKGITQDETPKDGEATTSEKEDTNHG